MKHTIALRLETLDYVHGKLSPEAFRAVCDADLVIRGHKIVKNRWGRITEKLERAQKRKVT